MTWLARDFRAHWNDPVRWTVGVWLALSVGLFAFVVRHGRNTPMWEEWLDLDGLYGVTSSLDWVFGRLQQHRYVLGRASMYGLFHATGGDFRVGLLVSVALLSSASALLIGTLRQLRGRSRGVDVVVPLLLMNPGAFENLLLGYQMHFTIDVFLIAAFVDCVAFADVRAGRGTAWRISVLTGLLALGGWVGLAFVPGATAWVFVLVRRGRRRNFLALVLPLLACGYFAWAYADVRRHPIVGQLDNGPKDTLRVAGEFFAMALGNFGAWWSPAAGLLVASFAVTLAAAQCAGILRSAGRRPVAIGVLAVVLALAMMAYGTGRHRASGFATRNIPLLAFLPILGLIHAVKFVGPVRRPGEQVGTAAAVLLALVIHSRGWVEGEKAANFYRTKYEMFASDRDAGLPLEFLVSRHLMFPCPEAFQGTRLLREMGHPAGRNVADAPDYRAVPLALPTPAPWAVPNEPSAKWVVGRPPVWRFALPERVRVTGVRVGLRFPRASERATIQILWPKPDGTTGVSVCMPWLTPNDWTLDFWIDQELGEFWLRPLDEADAFEVLSVEVLLPKH
jgi:hypothetical protein